MARIPDEVIERLKVEVALERLVEARGIELRPSGADLIGLCPFHDDRQPSLVVSPAKNLWHCMGACQAGGSVIDWVMRAEGVSFRHAVELLREGMPSTNGAPMAPARSTVRRLPPPVATAASDSVLLGQVIDFYGQTLKESPEALAYLERRRVGSPEAIATFRLGYANRTLGYRLPDKSRVAGAEMRGRLQALGIYRRSGHEHFAGSLVIPVVDGAGRVVEVYGRKLRDNLRAGTPLHLYLPGPHAGVWNAEALTVSSEIILCESLIDALTFWCAGFRHVTASYGAEGFTDEHLAAFRAAGTTRVLIAYDRDPAGDKGAAAVAETLTAAGVECFRVTFPAGADANDVACEAASATDALGRFIRAASWMGAGAGPPTRRQAAPAPAPPADAPAPDVAAPAPSFAAESPPATPVPPAPPPVPVDHDGNELRVNFDERRWRVRGLTKVTSFDLLRVNLLVARVDSDVFHVDTLDLYSARARTAFLKAAAAELGAPEDGLRRELGRVLLAAEEAVEEVVRAAQAPKQTAVTLTDAEREAALELLGDPRLVERIADDVARTGVVGEATNAVVAYLAAVSRKLDTPLAVIVQSTSAAGKSALMEAALALVPPEDRISYSAMTGQSLYYMGERDLAHKVLAVAEEEGAARAAYALKLLQSEGALSIASTGKDATTGRLVTHEYRVAGPVAIFLTTTAIDVDEELLNRCLVLTVDEDRDQTRAIQAAQRARQTLPGLLAEVERSAVVKLHQDAQRLLRPLLVANPYAPQLSFADERTRTRRDHMKYLTLIRAIALLHQHQRPIRTTLHGGQRLTYIEVVPADIALANRLAHEVLGRSLDELAPQTRRLLTVVEELVVTGCEATSVPRTEFRFTRRDVREHCGWSDFQVRTHLDRLVALEYVLVHRGGRGQSFVYELLYDGGGKDGRPFVMGLADSATLAPCDYDAGIEVGEEGIEGPTSPQREGIEGPTRVAGNGRPPAPLPVPLPTSAAVGLSGADEDASHVVVEAG